MTNSTPILFLSGAGLPAWIWDQVRAALPASATSSVASYPKQPDASLADYARKVLAEARGQEVILVAHSVGGVVAAEAVAQAPDRVRGLLAVTAAIPAQNQSFLRSMPFPQRLIVGAAMRLAGTKPTESAIRATLTPGIEDEQARRIVAEFSPESQALYRDAVGPRTFPARLGYLTTTRDREFPVALQGQFEKNLGATWTRSLDTGHLPMLEEPRGLAAAIADFAG